MHLFVLQLPDLRWAAHLHPKQYGPGEFRANLPQMPAGKYRLYADIVHDNGIAETATVDIDLPAQGGGRELDTDDSYASVHQAENGAYRFANGKRLVWTDAAEPVTTRAVRQYSFRVDGDAKVERYMGMAAHAAFIAEDGSVFAHVHPYGSVAMPAMMLAETPHAMSGPVDPMFRFPYGVPKPGRYRLLVQTKIDGVVETAVFPFEAR